MRALNNTVLVFCFAVAVMPTTAQAWAASAVPIPFAMATGELPGKPAYNVGYGWYSFRRRGDVQTLRLVINRDRDWCTRGRDIAGALGAVMDLWPQGPQTQDIRGSWYTPIARGCYHVAPRGSDAEAGVIAGVVYDGAGGSRPMQAGVVNLVLDWSQEGEIFLFTAVEVAGAATSADVPLTLAGQIAPKFCARVDTLTDPLSISP